jgi:hypothetical protein
MEPDYAGVVNAIVVAVVPVLVYYFRKVIPKLPRVLVWTLPMVFGSLISVFAELLAVPGANGWKGLLLGAVSLVLRELISTLREHGLNG